MKEIFLRFLLWQCLGVVTAQNISSLPTCGQNCIQTVNSDAVATADCNTNHSYCYCNRYDYVDKVKDCVSTSCTSASEQQLTNAYAQGVCSDAGSSRGGRGSSRDNSTFGPPPGSPSGRPPGPPQGSPPSLFTTSSSPPTSTSSPPASATNSESTTRASLSTGLSTGAKVGVGLGVTLAGLLIIGLIGALVWRKRKRRGRHIAEMDGQPKEMVYEADAYTKPSELEVKETDIPAPVYEMSGEQQRRGEQSRDG